MTSRISLSVSTSSIGAMLVFLVGACGGNGGSKDGLGAPIVTEMDCAALPAAMEGDPEGEKFWIRLEPDLSCVSSTPGTWDWDGAMIEFEYYGVRGEGWGNVLVTGTWESSIDAELKYVSVDAPEATEFEDFYGNGGATDLPYDQDITLTITDYNETRTIEIVFQLSPPYFILRSVTEL